MSSAAKNTFCKSGVGGGGGGVLPVRARAKRITHPEYKYIWVNNDDDADEFLNDYDDR